MRRGSLGFRLARILAYTATGMLLLWAAVQTVAIYRGADLRGEVGWDANLYATIGTHFLTTGQPYFPVQSGPYEAAGIVNLYPPTALYLFVPGSLLPRVLWWIVPLALIAWSLYRLRPAWWTWPLMSLACVVPLYGPAVPVALVYGNSLLWTLAALFAAAAFRPGLAWTVLFKPVDFLLAVPFALRSWRGLIVAVVLSAVLLPYWFDWLTALGNLNNGATPFYSLASWPALAMPFIAWVGRGSSIRNPVTKSAAPPP